jgi:hypothetical protein
MNADDSAPRRFPDADEALRVAIVAAVYAGDTGRARTLLAILDRKPSAARLENPTSLRCDIDGRTSVRSLPAATNPRRTMR